MKSVQGIASFREVGGGFGYRSDPQPPNSGGSCSPNKGHELTKQQARAHQSRGTSNKNLLHGEGRYLHAVFGILRIRVADNDTILAWFKVVQNQIV